MTERRNKNNINYTAVIMLSAAVVFFSAASSKLFAGINGIDTIGMFCVIAAAAFFACLLFLANYLMIFVVGITSLVLSLFIGKEILFVLLALAYIPIGLILFIGTVKKFTRTQIIVRISLFMALFYTALIIFYFIAAKGSFSIKMLSSAVDDALTGILNDIEKLINSVNNYYAGIQPGAAGASDIADIADITGITNISGVTYVFDENYKHELMMNLKMLIPSFFVLYGVFTAYLSTSVFRIFYNIFAVKSQSKKIKSINWRIKLSAVSAIIMIIGSIMMILSYDTDNLLPWIVASNIAYILTPGFCIMGVYFVYDKIYNGYNRTAYGGNSRKSGVIPALGLIFAFIFLYIFLNNIVIAVLTVLGVYVAIIGDIKQFYDKTKKFLFGGGGDDDDNDNDGDDF